MNRITRMLAMTGLSLVAGVTMAAGPAMASTGTGQASTQSTTSTVKGGGDWGHTVGYYRSLRSCIAAGRWGERLDRWEDFDCERSRFGRWALEVDFGGWGHWNRWDNNWDRFGSSYRPFWGGDRFDRWDRDGRGDRFDRFRGFRGRD